MRFALFGFDDYYPQGGWNDHLGTFATVDEALAAVESADVQGFQVVDLDALEVVATGRRAVSNGYACGPWERTK